MTEENTKPGFRIKSRIVTKALMLLGVILLPVIGLFQFMNYEGESIEKVLNQERSNLEYATRINRQGSSTALASGYLLIHLLMNNSRSSASWLKVRQAALDQTALLESFAKQANDPNRNKYVKQLVPKTYQALSEWSSIRPAESTIDIRDMTYKMKGIRYYFLFVYKLYNYFQGMESDEHTRLIDAIEKGRAERAQFTVGLNCALVFLFALGIGLVFIFSREITERLKIVVENATRLPQREKLNKEVGGTDEIAYLDGVLHQAAEKLEQSALFRKNLLEMVAHDMCSPLSAVNLSLAILQNRAVEGVSESSAGLFEKAGNHIEQLVLKANNLLSIERLCANSPDLAFADVDLARREATGGQEDESISELSRLIRVEFRSAGGLGSEAAKKFRPQIFKKGLLLVLIPLLFSAGMILWASQLNNKAARFLDEELKQSQIAFTINTLMRSTVAHMVINGCYQMYGDQENEELQPFIKRTGKNVTEQLLKLVNDDPWIMAEMKSLMELERKEDERLAQFKPIANDTRSLPTPAFAGPGRSLVVFSIKKMEKIQGITDHQIEKMAANRKAEEALQKQIETCLEVGTFGSVLIGFILLIFFNNDISRRLKTLTSNAERLPLRQQLNEFVKGQDEIWYLDFVLHDVSEILESTWQQRKVMMEVLADDLRKPLRETRDVLELVPSDESDSFDDVRKRHFNFATANVDRVLSLVDALLTIENLEQGKIELVKAPFVAKEAGQEAITSLTALAQDRKVTLANDCEDIEVDADKGRVIQVLVNFLGNAINHSPPDTTVRIDTSKTLNGVRFDVIDSGPGLSPEMRSKVFERFFQTADSKTKGKGYGLGLAICRMIAEAHGGTVGCDAAPTGGCSFYAIFPTDKN